MALHVTEIFHSIQGESTRAGLPCTFIRLSGCNLRCTWCDTAYAHDDGVAMTIGEILCEAARHPLGLVTVTGGEPLLQAGTPALITALVEAGYDVQVETNGSLDISLIDPRSRLIMDLKCPGSGMERHNRIENLALLRNGDEVKFVITDKEDYRWACGMLREHRFNVGIEVLFAPAFDRLAPARLAEWILADTLRVRLQMQLHRYIWPDRERGV